MESQPTEQPDFVPAQPAATTTPVDTVAASNRKRTVLALWLMIGPTALIVVSILLYAVANFIMAQTMPQSDAMFAESSVGETIVNVILFIIGAVSVITWLPGLIIGIILLATKKK
jgi:heme/copper-type cytochrome/quinol oxidase subunit 2